MGDLDWRVVRELMAVGERLREVVERATIDGFSATTLLGRFDQFVEESTVIIPAAGDALARGDVATFGDLVDRSQHRAESLLGNQVPETVMLARSARELGALAASAFGAGFGGSVWALVEEPRAASFAARWEAGYRGAFPQVSPAFLVTGAGPAAGKLS